MVPDLSSYASFCRGILHKLILLHKSMCHVAFVTTDHTKAIDGEAAQIAHIPNLVQPPVTPGSTSPQRASACVLNFQKRQALPVDFRSVWSCQNLNIFELDTS